MHVLGTPPAFVLSQDQTLVFNPFESQKLSLPSSKLILELTVFSQLRLVKIAVRVLLDSVSFSRIILCPLGLVARADSSIIISQPRPSVNTFFELFLTVFETFSSLFEFCHPPNTVFSCWRKKKNGLSPSFPSVKKGRSHYVLQSKICPRLSLKASRAENGLYLYFRREIA